MNAIQCKNCWDILVPIVGAGIRNCHCSRVAMRAVDPREGILWLVEVKLSTEGDAQVVKINNHFLMGRIGPHTFLQEQREQNDLFYQNGSQIVIAPLDTPGVKVVDNWSNTMD